MKDQRIISPGKASDDSEMERTLRPMSLGQKTLQILGIDDQGLDPMDRKILSLMIDKFDGGPVELNTIEAFTDNNATEYKINSIVTAKVNASDNFGTIKQIKWGCSIGNISFDADTTFNPAIRSISDIPFKATLPSEEVQEYRCVFKAIDDDGEEGFDTLTFTTLLDEPSVRLSIQEDVVLVQSEQSLNAFASDKFGKITDYAYACSNRLADLKNPSWEKMTSSQVTVTMPSTPTEHYYCVVQVTDDDRNTARDTADYKVVVGRPSVTAMASRNVVPVDEYVDLNVYAADSLGGEIIKYEWGCGSSSATNIKFSESKPKVSMKTPSTPQDNYRCVVRVTDNDDNTAKDSVFINIIPKP